MSILQYNAPAFFFSLFACLFCFFPSLNITQLCVCKTTN
jgi:hypothetical protein